MRTFGDPNISSDARSLPNQSPHQRHESADAPRSAETRSCPSCRTEDGRGHGHGHDQSVEYDHPSGPITCPVLAAMSCVLVAALVFWIL
ncbi:hypothetical protein ABH939_006392 [Rhodococcus sp. 27YEA6]|jgi:hypothetical protein